jgi:hypothetical protein
MTEFSNLRSILASLLQLKSKDSPAENRDEYAPPGRAVVGKRAVSFAWR